MKVGNVNFTGASSAASSFVCEVGREAQCYSRNQKVQKELLKVMPKSIRTIDKMSSFVGEVPNIVINAIGTGLVAPIFIKYNFLSKTDEDTRTYSAARQPVSAILAVLIQAGLVIPVDRGIENLVNSGYFDNSWLDQKGIQDVKYLQRQLKKENPNLPKADLKKLAEEKQLEQMQKLIDSLRDNHKIEYAKNGAMHVLPQEDLDKLLRRTVDSMLDDTSSTLKRYEGEKIYNQVERGDFLRKNSQEVLKSMQEVQNAAAANKSEEELAKWFKNQIGQMKKENASKDLIQIYDELSCWRSPDIVGSKAGDIMHKTRSFEACADKKAVWESVMGELKKTTLELQEEKAVLERLKKAIYGGKSVEEVLTEAKNLKNSNFVYEVIQKHSKNVSSNLKGFKQVTGLLVGLVTLPISCYALNWIYPKIMDKFFPELSKKKKNKSGDKFTKAPAPQAPAPSTEKGKEVRQ